MSLIGMLVDNRYEIKQLINSGAFGDVYLAVDTKLKRQVALKVFSRMNIQSKKDETAFLNEALSLAALEHPNIVAIYDYGVMNINTGNGIFKHAYLVLQYAAYGSLREKLREPEKLTLANCVLYTKQLASAIDYMHDKGIIHRDLKPENILFRSLTHLLITDFGTVIEKHSKSSLRDQDVVGTFCYMSREQFKEQAVAASDIFSLGVIVYEFLSEGFPYGENLLQILTRYQSGTTADPLPSAIPSTITQVVMKAIELDPEDRYLRASEFADALEEAVRISSYEVKPNDIDPAIYTLPTMRTSSFINKSVVSYKGHKNATYAQWSPDGQYIASAGDKDGSIHLWTPSTGKLVKKVMKHKDIVYCVGWSPDGKYIASSSKDLQIWEVATGKTISLVETDNPIRTITWAYSGSHLAFSDGITFHYLDVLQTDLIEAHSHEDEILQLAWSPTGSSVASCSKDMTMKIWDVANTGELLWSLTETIDDQVFSLRDPQARKCYINTVAWSPQGTHIGCGTNRSIAYVYTFDGTEDSELQEDSPITSFVWSPDGSMISLGKENGEVDLCQFPSYQFSKRVSLNQKKPVTSISWHPTDEYIVACQEGDSLVNIWYIQ